MNVMCMYVTPLLTYDATARMQLQVRLPRKTYEWTGTTITDLVIALINVQVCSRAHR